MNEGLKALYSGDFNTMRTDNQPDGTVIITLSKTGDTKSHHIHVKDLYGIAETVIDYQQIDTSPASHIIARLYEANPKPVLSTQVDIPDIEISNVKGTE